MQHSGRILQAEVSALALGGQSPPLRHYFCYLALARAPTHTLIESRVLDLIRAIEGERHSSPATDSIGSSASNLLAHMTTMAGRFPVAKSSTPRAGTSTARDPRLAHNPGATHRLSRCWAIAGVFHPDTGEALESFTLADLKT